MNTSIAFLRGINVGGRIVKMADLKACFEQLGFSNIRTILQTGNVIFETDNADKQALRERIESAVGETFNYDATVLIFSQDEVIAAMHGYPYDSSDETQQHYVIFCDNEITNDLFQAGEQVLNKDIESLALGQSVLYWRVPKGMTLETPLAKLLTKAPYKEKHTVRNLKTLRKIVL